MACRITVNSPVGWERNEGEGITRLTVSGIVTVTDGSAPCSGVTVRIIQTDPHNAQAERSNVVVTDGEWSVDFVAPDDFQLGDFVCGGGVKGRATADCSDNSDCERGVFPITTGFGCGCPDGRMMAEPDPCVDGRVLVRLRAEIVTEDEATYTWYFGTFHLNAAGEEVEDSQAGDGQSSDYWLPPPNANGVRVVSTDHVYEGPDERTPISVRLETSSGPNAVCSNVAQRVFELDSCLCELAVTVAVTPDREENGCWPAGDYTAAITSPAEDDGDLTYSWSVNGAAPVDSDGRPVDRTQRTLPFSIAAGDREKAITVEVTRGGCDASNGVTLNVCEDCSDFAAEVRVQNRAGVAFSVEECLPKGEYTVTVTRPPDDDSLDYFWSMGDGRAPVGSNIRPIDRTQRSLPFSIAAGEEKTFTVIVTRGTCVSNPSVTVKGCAEQKEEEEEEDCSDYKAELRILGEMRRDVTNEKCLEPGDYTVQATSPGGQGNTFTWEVDGEEVDGEEGDTPASVVRVTLGENESKTVTFRASRGGCSDEAEVVLEACKPETPKRHTLTCLIFKIFALMGLGAIFLGVILLLCPDVMLPLFLPPVDRVIAIGCLVIGAILLLIFLPLWICICKPDCCEWVAFLWQALILAGLLMVYAGFCPGCSWMLLGLFLLLVGAIVLYRWKEECDVTYCYFLTEIISLFTFAATPVVAVEFVFAWCVISTRPLLAFLWGLALAILQAVLWAELLRNDCIRDIE